MRRALFCASIVIAAAGIAEAKRPPRPKLTCEKPSTHLNDRQADFAKFTGKAFDDALAREMLTKVSLTAKALRPDDPLLKGVKRGATFKLGTGSAAPTAVFFRSGTMWQYGGDEFVKDQQGEIHALVRKENVIGSETHTMCGCGPMGGGAVPPPASVVYVLPDGATYGAPIELSYDAKRVFLSYSNVVDGKLVVCNPPP
ncbi:MAG TPA: hypothetical protein VL463_06325 [Kofleriaceae bacterium]|jgi:hypothetical protein|nr:hypothetical protein [Kofleriaceae bacterium]